MQDRETLYNVYRPSEFTEIYGQDSTVKIIEEQIRTKTLPHSLLFYGPKGVGKTSVARIVAKAYNPYSAGIKEIDASQDRRVENIRNLIPDLNLHIMEGDHLTVIFDEAHQMTHDAFQALQKVVEEPPEDVRFIFVTTRVDKIPDTIVDRSQRHHFVKIPQKIIYQRVKEIADKEFPGKISEELLSYIVHVADGSLRSALVSLGEVVSILNTDCSGLDIAEMLGILGGPKISNFVYLYVTGASLNQLLNALGMFDSDRVDLYKAFSDYQQFLMDCLLYLSDESIVEYLKFDVKPLFEKLKSGLQTGYTFSHLKPLLVNKLETAYDYSLKYENDLRTSNNQSSVLRRYLTKILSENANS